MSLNFWSNQRSISGIIECITFVFDHSKGKGTVHPRISHEGPDGGRCIQLYSFFNLGARWGGFSTPHPGCFTTEKETRFPLYRGLGGPQGESGRVRKISPPPELDGRTLQSLPTELSRPTFYRSNNGNEVQFIKATLHALKSEHNATCFGAC